MRLGMYSGTLAMPVSRPRISAVCLVFVRDHIALPVTSRSLNTQIKGAAAASSASWASCRRVRSGVDRAE